MACCSRITSAAVCLCILSCFIASAIGESSCEVASASQESTGVALLQGRHPRVIGKASKVHVLPFTPKAISDAKVAGEKAIAEAKFAVEKANIAKAAEEKALAEAKVAEDAVLAEAKAAEEEQANAAKAVDEQSSLGAKVPLADGEAAGVRTQPKAVKENASPAKAAEERTLFSIHQSSLDQEAETSEKPVITEAKLSSIHQSSLDEEEATDAGTTVVAEAKVMEFKNIANESSEEKNENAKVAGTSPVAEAKVAEEKTNVTKSIEEEVDKEEAKVAGTAAVAEAKVAEEKTNANTSADGEADKKEAKQRLLEQQQLQGLAGTAAAAVAEAKVAEEKANVTKSAEEKVDKKEVKVAGKIVVAEEKVIEDKANATKSAQEKVDKLDVAAAAEAEKAAIAEAKAAEEKANAAVEAAKAAGEKANAAKSVKEEAEHEEAIRAAEKAALEEKKSAGEKAKAAKAAEEKALAATKVAEAAAAAAQAAEEKANAAKAAEERVKGKAPVTPPDDSNKGMARQTLPPHLLELGIELLGHEDVLDYVIANTREERIPYAGQEVVLRMILGDASDGTMREEGGSLYGLDTLPQSGMINLLDLGGNYGVVSIAAYLRFPSQVRAIAVEPIPSTYFLFRWNLYLNNVPELAVEQLADPKSKSIGVLAIHNGVANENWAVTDFCYSPPYTMNAHICDCDQPHNELQCAGVVGITLEQLFSYFHGQPITMLKMDCEGCEESALPALAKAVDSSPGRVQRLVGELHAPTLALEDIACRFDQGKYFVKICLKDGEYVGRSLGCGNPGRSMCD